MAVRTTIVTACLLVAFVAGVAAGLSWPTGTDAARADRGAAEAKVPVLRSPAQQPGDAPAQPPYPGRVLAIGDSVLMGAEACLAKRPYRVDAQTSRQVWQGADDLQLRIANGQRIPDRVLVHLGTNGGATPEDLDRIMWILGSERIVTFATIQLPDDPSRYTFETSTNTAIRAMPLRYDNARVMDWQRATRSNPGWLYADGYHIAPEGCDAYAALADEVVRAP